MGDDSAAVGEQLAVAGAALVATDARLAEADRLLIEAVRSAHRVAVESIRELEAVRAQIDAAVARRRTDTAAAAQEMSRFLLDANRRIAEIVRAARAESAAKAVALQALRGQYTV